MNLTLSRMVARHATRKKQAKGDGRLIAGSGEAKVNGLSPQRKRAMAGRKRKLEPDPRTPEGQCALYLRKLLDGKDYSQVAESVDLQRSTLFNYVAGTTTPSDSIRDRLAKALGYRDYRDLMPTDEFLKSIGQLGGKNRRS